LVYVNKTFLPLDLTVDGGKISGLYTPGSLDALESRECLDAKGLWVLPGFIDPHVHFALGVGATKSVDDFVSGSRSAVWGGVTSYIDFLDPVSQAQDMEAAFQKRQTLATDSLVDYSFHSTLASPAPGNSASDFVAASLALNLSGLKVFTAYSSSNRRTQDREIYELLQACAEQGAYLLVHAENESMMDLSPSIPVARHEDSRPALSEISQILTLAESCRQTKGKLSIVHTTCGTSLKRLRKHYADILNSKLFIESCPHYFDFDTSVYAKPEAGLYTMTPPLRQKAEMESLREEFASIASIGTDHCAYMKAQKQAEFTSKLPMGIGSIEFSFSALFSRFGADALPLFTENPAKIHGLWPRKGNLLPGADADIVLFDPKKQWQVQELHGTCDYSVYEGKTLSGQVQSTLSRGRILLKDRTWQGPEKGGGLFLKR